MNTLKGIIAGIERYFVAIVAGLIGIAVLAFQARGRKIHRLQVELLEKTLDAKELAADQAVNSALEKYQKAKEAYEAAGGKLE